MKRKFHLLLSLIIIISTGLAAQDLEINKIEITGEIYDTSGKPLSEVDIELKLSDSLIYFTSTSATGNYSFLINVDLMSNYHLKITLKKDGFTTQHIGLNNYVKNNITSFKNTLKPGDGRFETIDYYTATMCWWMPPPIVNPYNPSSQTTWTAEDISRLPRY